MLFFSTKTAEFATKSAEVLIWTTTVRKISTLGNPLDLLTAYVFLWTAPNANQLSTSLKFADPAL